MHTGIYPAFRPVAKLRRTVLRWKAAAGFSIAQPNPGNRWLLGEFVGDCLPGANEAVVLLGTPGPAQKLTAQIWGEEGVIGFVKYAESPPAMVRLLQEYNVLSSLPLGRGPVVLKYAAFARGQALVTAPVVGTPSSARLRLNPALLGFLTSLEHTEEFDLERHPWTARIHDRFDGRLDAWLEHLAGRRWKAVIQHGDFAPWNVYVGKGGCSVAVDWEYGHAKGFPYIDATHFLLQVAALVKRWPPGRTFGYVTRYLNERLGVAESGAIVRIAAFEAYQNAIEDGQASSSWLQTWRRQLWESA